MHTHVYLFLECHNLMYFIIRILAFCSDETATFVCRFVVETGRDFTVRRVMGDEWVSYAHIRLRDGMRGGMYLICCHRMPST